MSVVLAQLPTGTILGQVKDASGAVVAGAKVTARDTDTGQTRTAVTGDDGAYRLDALPVGNYEITAEKDGFQDGGSKRADPHGGSAGCREFHDSGRRDVADGRGDGRGSAGQHHDEFAGRFG